MDEIGEIDQFQLLEEKIDSLIDLVTNLRKEKTLLSEKLKIQEGKLADLTDRIVGMESTREKAKQRIMAMLEKFGQLDT